MYLYMFADYIMSYTLKNYIHESEFTNEPLILRQVCTSYNSTDRQMNRSIDRQTDR